MSITVSTQVGCAWQATTSDGWIHITTGSGSGGGEAQYFVDPNSSPASRSGTIAIAGHLFPVQQNGFMNASRSLEQTATQSFPQSSHFRCIWTFVWTPSWGLATTELRFEVGERQDTHSQSGCCGSLTSAINLLGEFLPTTIGTCSSKADVIWPGAGSRSLPWESVVHQWVNPTCNGHPLLEHGNDPQRAYWVSDDMWNTDGTMASGATNAGSYWTDVGKAVHFPTLSTPIGLESGVFPHPFPLPGVYAEVDPVSKHVWLNHVHFPHLSAEQWGWITAHELGHTIGFGHSGSSDQSKTIMVESSEIPGTDLTPRKLDKCGAVWVFPTNLRP